MEMETQIPSLKSLVASLEQATLMAKQLPNTTDPSQILHIYSTLQSTNTHLSSFLSHPPASPPPPAAAPEPMEVGDSEDVEEAEQNTTIETVEERMRDCFIQNKRHKRALSPSAVAAAEQRRSYEYKGEVEFDPLGTKMRALDLVYQFHG